LVDTAGRLHTDERLREELKKVVRVVAKRHTGAPHESLLVLDATVGQNAVLQAESFAAAVPLTGLVITKLDGTAKGGSVVAQRRRSALSRAASLSRRHDRDTAGAGRHQPGGDLRWARRQHRRVADAPGTARLSRGAEG